MKIEGGLDMSQRCSNFMINFLIRMAVGVMLILKWILRVKRDSGKGGAESNNNGRLRNIRSPGGCPAIWCGLL